MLWVLYRHLSHTVLSCIVSCIHTFDDDDDDDNDDDDDDEDV